MRRRSVRLWAALAVEVGAAAAAIVAGGVPVRASPQALAVGVATAFLLFGGLTRQWPVPPRCPRDRLPLLAAKSGVIFLKSASEEVLWRGLALGRLAALAGVPVGAALATGGFALAHVRPLGRRGLVVHLVTGGAFAAVFLATSLAAAIAAHCTYNLLVALAVERERRRRAR